MDRQEHKEREHFFGAAKVVAGLTLLSRVFGMIRDMTIVWLGAKWQNDAFQFAFALPNLFRRLFGEGALAAAFVPAFTETSEQRGPDRARLLLANVMAMLAAALAVLTLLILAGFWIWLACSPPGRQDRQFLTLLTGIMLPYMILVCMLALGSAALNCRGHFVYPAFAPILLNLCMIAADGVAAFFWRGSKDAQLITISVSVTAAGVIQLAGVFWLLHRSGLAMRPRFRPVEEGLWKLLKFMGPTILVAGFLQLSSLFDYLAGLFFSANEYTRTIDLLGWQISRPLEQGVLVQLTAAQRLYQFPMGVLAISLGVAVFPLLSRYAVRNDMANLRSSVNRAFRLALMEGLASGVGMFVLAEPILKLIYRHYDFSEADADKAVFFLRMYLLGMWAYCTHQILLRTFYSLKENRTPLRVTGILSLVYMAMATALLFVPGVGAAGFGITNSVTFSINVLVLLVLLHRRLGDLGGRQLLASAARSLLASGVMAGGLEGILWLMKGQHNGLIVAITVPVGAALFIGAAWLLRCPELGELFGALRRKPADNTPPNHDSSTSHPQDANSR